MRSSTVDIEGREGRRAKSAVLQRADDGRWKARNPFVSAGSNVSGCVGRAVAGEVGRWPRAAYGARARGSRVRQPQWPCPPG
jgi:hypothetical protein